MYDYNIHLMKQERPNPYIKNIDKIVFSQARIYANQDHLLPEDQWAQITMRFDLKKENGDKVKQYNVFERRLTDKLSYFDWRLSF